MTTPAQPDSAARFRVLDALRFVLAFWVAIGHYESFPLFAGVDASTSFGRFVTHAWSSVVFGTPAVIVFFVISGFCIHSPFRGRAPLTVSRFYLRRYTRILVPVAGALILYHLFGQSLRLLGEHSILWESPLWSLLCEEIYYAAYPLLRFLRNRFGWRPLFVVAFPAGVAVALTHPHAGNWHIFGPLGTATILLPVWLLGALLAEQADSLPALSSSAQIWFWRFATWLGCWTAEMIHFKAKISYTLTMIPFGVLAYFWVQREVRYSRVQPPSQPLVAAGAWSYSLYLVHAQGMELFARLPIPNLGYLLTWVFTMASALLFAYLFYVFVERPSHRLARRVRLSPANPAPTVTSTPAAEAAP
jgi:peptidoglycan/LPS O-acetylase OafA/YrhL